MTPFSLTLEVDGHQEKGPFFIYRYPLETTLPYFDATAEVLRDVAKTTRDLGGRYVFALSPRFHHWDKTACPDNWEKGFYALDEPYEFEMFRYFEERREQLGFDVINLLPALRATKEKPLVFPDDPHWTSGGCRVAAEFVAAALITDGSSFAENPSGPSEPAKMPDH